MGAAKLTGFVALALTAFAATAFGESPTVTFVPGTRVHRMPVRDPNAPIAHAAAGGAQLLYYGGHVIPNIKVVVVFWGPNVNPTTTAQIGAFYGAVTNSTYFDWLSEYNTNIQAQDGSQGTNQSIGRGTFATAVTITPSSAAAGTTIDDSVIQSELESQINAGALPTPDENTLYVTYFAPGTTITQGGSSSCQAGSFCAYHGTFQHGAAQTSTYYSVLPDFGAGSGCDTGCGSDPVMFNNLTSASSHEMIESVTDAEVGLAQGNAAPLAWYDQQNGEIGDICNGQPGTVGAFTVQLEWSNSMGACIASNPAVPTGTPVSTTTTPPPTPTPTATVTAPPPTPTPVASGTPGGNGANGGMGGCSVGAAGSAASPYLLGVLALIGLGLFRRRES